MEIKNLIIVAAILLFTPNFSNSQTLEKKEAIVEFLYEQDSMTGNYYLKKKIIKFDTFSYFLVPSPMDIIVTLEIDCKGKDSMLSYNKEEKIEFLYNLKQFQDTTKLDNDFYRHYGGDMYKINTNLIGIIFHIDAYMIKLNQSPCDKFAYGFHHSCRIDYDKPSYPMVVVLGVIKSKSLSKREIKKYHIKPFRNKSFPRRFCD
jgi:hypothetical protein